LRRGAAGHRGDQGRRRYRGDARGRPEPPDRQRHLPGCDGEIRPGLGDDRQGLHRRQRRRRELNPIRRNGGIRLRVPPPMPAPEEKCMNQSPHRLRVEDLTVVPPRRTGLWIATALTLAFLALLAWAIATNKAFAWPVVGKYLFH